MLNIAAKYCAFVLAFAVILFTKHPFGMCLNLTFAECLVRAFWLPLIAGGVALTYAAPFTYPALAVLVYRKASKAAILAPEPDPEPELYRPRRTRKPRMARPHMARSAHHQHGYSPNFRHMRDITPKKG